MEQSNEIARLIEPVVSGLGYELVRVQTTGGRYMTLQIMAERQDRRAMLVDDCARLSRTISALLDTADPIAGEYTLEVSSPGIDRPLMKRADYERFAGHEAKIEIDPPVAGRKRFQGAIGAIEGEELLLECADGAIKLPMAAIRKGKLVLTERLIASEHKDVETTQDGAAAASPHIHL